MKLLTLLRLLYRRFVRNDHDSGLYILVKIGKLLAPGYRYTYPLAWWQNEKFNFYLRRFGELDGLASDRHWMLAQLCRLTHDVPGDTAECGSYQGASSYLICLANQGQNRTHHIFDSFEGLSEPGPHDGSNWSAGDMAVSLETVKEALEGLGTVRYYKGWIPERFHEVTDRSFSFVHVDVDLEQPTMDSVRFFYDRLAPGGILLCDDYGFTSCPAVAPAIDEFLADKPEKIIALGGGGGFFIKGQKVGPASSAVT
jgi:O-methyltransferase